MTGVILAVSAISLVLFDSPYRLWAPLPAGLALGWAWGGPAGTIPFGTLAMALPASLDRWGRNRKRRRRQGDIIRSLEAMLERSHLTSNLADVAGQGGTFAKTLWAADESAPIWLVRAFQHVVNQSHSGGAPIHRALTLIVEEARERVRLESEVESQNGAMVAFVFFFLAIELVLTAWVLIHPEEVATFRSGIGLALGLWVVLSTSLTLVLPWLREGTSLW